jgi:spermidine synthase
MRPASYVEWFSRQLRLLSELPDGLVYQRTKSSHKLTVLKQGSHIQLAFFDGVSGEVQSRLDFNDPLYLVAPYTQALVLSLACKIHPQKIHIIGFGGGRIPMIIHTYFPDVQIDCTEIDGDVVGVAQEFFGVRLDENLKVFVQDGRRFLRELDPAVQYDIIMVDAFDGTGSSPFPLSTMEFYEECAKHLLDDGLVVVNVLLSDRQYDQKVRTLRASFSHTWMVSTNEWGGSVFYATRKNNLTKQEIVERARQLEESYNFSFPLVEHAHRIVAPDDVDEFIDAPEYLEVLTDSRPPEPEPLPDIYFRDVGPNDPCPCGSGRIFKKCHGRG